MSKRGQGEAIKWILANQSHDGDDCLIWPFSRNSETGYGMFGYLGESRYAHVFMCDLVNGPKPSEEHETAHSCGKGHDGCVHPKHVVWKTHQDNLLDKRAHGTHVSSRYGNKGHVTDEQVALIRSLKGKKSQYDIARMVGVSRGCIQYWHGIREQRNPRTVR